MKYLITILYLFFSLNGICYSQDTRPVKRSDDKVIIENKVYYKHIVKRGQTLSSIAKAYNLSEKEIIIENPGASADLWIGQYLKIPLNPNNEFKVNTGPLGQGKKKHVVKAGDTVYSLSRLYNCSVDDILQANPGMEINNLQIGSKIILPSGEEKQNDLSFDEEGFIFHKVKRGETLSSISRYYNVTVNELRAVNPEVSWGGPRTGDVIRIPEPNTSVEEIFLLDTTTYTPIAEDIFPKKSGEDEIYSYDDLSEVMNKPSKMYKVAYLIPFNYSEMVPLDTLLKNEKSPMRIKRITHDYLLEAAVPKSVNFLEFLEGSLMAVDSLTDNGLNLDIHVYDTKNSMYATRQILEDPEMRDMDLIIGPFFSYNLEIVTQFSKENKIPLVTPFYSNDTLLLKNPFLIQSMPSSKVEYKRNAEFIGREYNCNLIFVHDDDSSKLLDINFYKQALFSELETYAALESVLFKEVVISDGNFEGLIHALNPDIRNLVILPSRDEAFSSQVVSKIYYELGNFDIELFGSSYWLGFDDIDISYIHELQLIVSSTHWYDYSDPKFLSFLDKFRTNYYKEPENYTIKGCNFGVMGYDLSLYFLSALRRYGKRFIAHLDDFKVKENLCQFNYERISRSGGFENTEMHYYYFDKDLNVRTINLPEKPPMYQYNNPAGEDPFYYQWSEPQPDTTVIEDR